MIFSEPRLSPLGESAILLELADEINLDLNARIHALARYLDAHPRAGYVENVPGYASLVVHFDPLRATSDEITQWIRDGLENARVESDADTPLIEIPARYGGEFGPDLAFVAQINGKSEREVIEIHTSHIYRVYMLGFAPGFAYLGELPNEIAAPRLDTPRTRVPAGSVAIAGRQTGVYPRASPGGWRIIGRTEVKLFDPAKNPPTLLKPGDRVRFTIADF